MSDNTSYPLAPRRDAGADDARPTEHAPILSFSAPALVREAISLTLAAADVCWLTPIYMALIWTRVQHVSLWLWLGMLVLMLGFFYFYRFLVAANLSLRIQQGLLAVGLLLTIGFVLRFHVLNGLGLPVQSPSLSPLAQAGDPAATLLTAWLTAVALIAIWARAVHLANRSLSAESVGFSFRAGILLLTGALFFVRFLTSQDMSVFVALYFFLTLAAVALARVEQVSNASSGGRAGFNGYWILSMGAAVVALVLLGLGLMAFLQGGGLGLILKWLSPLMLVIQWIVVGLGVLILMVVEWILSLFSVDLGSLGQSLQQAFEQLELLLASPMPETPPVDQSASSPAILRILQALVTVGLPALVVVLVLVLTWRRVRAARPGRREDDERESLLSARVVASSLQSALRSGLDQLSRLAEATGKLGPAGRFFAALSVRRIYANLIRLAAESGHPRAEAQTPYEYLPTLLGAFPDNVEEVKAITEAYVGAHYGQLPDSQQELQRLRACWERIRAWSVSK